MADVLFLLAGAELVLKAEDQQNYRNHQKNGRKVGKGEVYELLSVALTKKVDQKIPHRTASVKKMPLLYHTPPKKATLLGK
jgi:hypothetical protein